MKKYRPILLLLITVVVFSGCQFFGSSDNEPNFDLTSYADTQDKALGLFLDVDDALYAAFLNNATGDDDNLTWTGSYRGGEVSVQGSVSEPVVTEPEEGFNPFDTPDNPDLDVYTSSSSSSTEGSVTDVVLTIDSKDYKVSAEITSSSSLDYSIDIETEGDTYTLYGNYTLNIAFDFSATIIKDGGMGARIDILYNTNDISGQNIIISDINDYSPIIDDVMTNLGNTEVAMEVYEVGADTPTDTYTITIADLFEDSDFIIE